MQSSGDVWRNANDQLTSCKSVKRRNGTEREGRAAFAGSLCRDYNFFVRWCGIFISRTRPESSAAGGDCSFRVTTNQPPLVA